jgi:hypothetical protein
MRISAVPHLSPSDIRAPGVNDNEEAGWAVGAEWAYQGHIYKHVGNGAWVDLAGGDGGPSGPVDWADISGKPATFPPTLPIAQSGVTGLETALNAKIDEGDPRLTDARPPTAHALTSHTATGLTAGHVLRATGATAYGFGAIQDSDLPATIARDSEVSAAVAAHEAAADPHPGYQRESEKGQANGYAGLDATGKVPAGQLPAQSGGGNSRVVLAADVTASATANALTDVPGLSIPLTAGQAIGFRFVVRYTAAATTTGSRWTLNGPATSLLLYRSEYTLTATSRTFNEGLTTYGVPAASNASSIVAGNMAVIEGWVTASANGTLVLRFASEIASSAITAKVGSWAEWWAL